MVRAVPLIASAALLLAACGDAGELDAGEPERVRLEATATRSSLFDSQRTFRLELHNVGDGEVVVDTVQLASPMFVEVPPAERGTVLQPGQQLLIPLPFGESACPEGEGPTSLRVVSSGEALEVPLAQHPEDVLGDLHALECEQAAVGEAVDLSFGDAWVPTGPRSASGAVVVAARGTTAPTIEAVEGNIVFGIRIGAGVLPAISTFPIEVVVDRCDTHALIESKRTFKFPLEVSLDGGPPVAYVLQAEVGTPARAVFADLIQACIG
jgi:hypothetical protein